MNVLELLVMAVVQGITEFLPVSSDGHLAILQQFFDVEGGNLTLVVGLHAGTLASVVTYYRKDLWDLTRHGPSALFANDKSKPAPIGMFSGVARSRLIIAIVVGSVPTAAIGLALRGPVERWTLSAILVGVFLIATGAANMVVAYVRRGQTRGPESLSVLDAVLIGAAQGLAVLPGLSRSGSTIATGVALGLDKDFAARFSFLLSVPAVAGATLLYLPEIISGDNGLNPFMLAAGALVSFGVGIGALHALIKILERGKFAVFGWYCFVLGPTMIAVGVLT